MLGGSPIPGEGVSRPRVGGGGGIPAQGGSRPLKGPVPGTGVEFLSAGMGMPCRGFHP